MAKTRKPTNHHSWVALTAVEITRNTGLGASEAHLAAETLAFILVVKRSEDLLECDPRDAAIEYYGVDEMAVRAAEIARRTASWLGQAADEIDKVTTFGASASARYARTLADHIKSKGLRLLDTKPRLAAQAHFGVNALASGTAERRKERAALGIPESVHQQLAHSMALAA
ncbi:hypothetical protein [Sphingomonas oryzagri]